MLLRVETDATSDPGALATAGQALYGLISDAVRRIPRDMSLTSLSTLSTLDRTGPRRITDLAVIQGVAQPSMTTLVTVLQRSGLVERRADPADRRVALVEITAAGLAFMRARRRAGAEAFTDLIGKLPPDESALLLAAVPALEHLCALGNQQGDPSAPSAQSAHRAPSAQSASRTQAAPRTQVAQRTQEDAEQ
jgi:DNA-binding MarR family transcriptional regulator